MRNGVMPRLGLALMGALILAACSDAAPGSGLEASGGLADPTAPATLAGRPAGEHGSISVKLKRNATRRAAGQLVIVEVQVRCAHPVGEVLEALVTVEQDDAFGEGFLSDVQCDGRTHFHDVRVQSFDGRFETGRAFASAFILICDEEGSSASRGRTAA